MLLNHQTRAEPKWKKRKCFFPIIEGARYDGVVNNLAQQSRAGPKVGALPLPEHAGTGSAKSCSEKKNSKAQLNNPALSPDSDD
jgi:hypothetical protein